MRRRTGTGTSRPSRAASRRQGWQCETWRASRRWSRRPKRSPLAAMSAWMRTAALARRELVVLLAEALARAEQGALDRRAAHAHALADVLVAQPLELAQDEDLVVAVGEARRTRRRDGRRPPWRRPPRPARGRSRRVARDRRREPVVGVERDLLGAPAAAVGVDAGVLGDLVDPGLEGDRPLGLAHAAQRGDEHLLRDVLGAAVVLDHAADVGGDAALVALVELLEGAVVAAAHGAHQLMVRLRSAALPAALNERRAAHPHRFHGTYPTSALTEFPIEALPVPGPGQPTCGSFDRSTPFPNTRRRKRWLTPPS